MLELNRLIIYFFIYAFLGWLIESIYQSIIFKKPVNSGLLIGPFVPVYGFGVVTLLIIESYISDTIPLWMRIIIYTFIATIIEYYTGALLEEVFHMKLWDYSGMFLNIKGRVCFLHTFYWVALSYLLIKYLHIIIKELRNKIQYNYLIIFNYCLIIYVTIDLLYSIRFMNNFISFILKLKKNFMILPKLKFENFTKSKQRLIYTFPILRDYFSKNIKDNIKNLLNKVTVLKNKKAIQLNKSDDNEYNEYIEIIKDIINHSKFQELKKYKHHDSTIFNHLLSVARATYKITKLLKLNYKSATRGALLHDFFFYDWCIDKPIDNNIKKTHAFYHPKEAYKNAIKYFNLDEIEKDIILKHMFPVTIKLPKCKESIIVSIIDKIISSKELINEIINNFQTSKLKR